MILPHKLMGNYFSYIAHLYHMSMGRPRGYYPTNERINETQDATTYGNTFG